MRRRIIALALLCSACLPFVTPASGLAQTEGATVAFTIHAATCPLDYGGGSIYEACHENFLGGATYLLSGTDLAATQIVTGVDGVGEVQILSGVTSASDVVLAEDPIGQSSLGGWVYCKDQISGFVLFDGPIPENGSIAIGTLTTTQWVICDWYRYGDLVVAAPEVAAPPVIANG